MQKLKKLKTNNSKLKAIRFYAFFVFLFFWNLVYLNADEIRAIWVLPWDINSPEKIDQMIKDVYDCNLNQIFIEVRYRGDTFYQANKSNTDFYNPEEFSYILNGSQFDALEYTINKAKPFGIKVHAWVTTFVVTPHFVDKLPSSHVYYQHPEWFTIDTNDEKMHYLKREGIFLDPALPEVQDYTLSVFQDIVSNYDIDGIHLDYIRYPGENYGYHPVSKELFNSIHNHDNSSDWQVWKENQINRFMRRTYVELKTINSELIVSAAVLPNITKARNTYSQNWLNWLENGCVDYVYLMAYDSSDSRIKLMLENISEYQFNQKIVAGLRAWDEKNRYKPESIVSKIKLTRKNDFAGISLFSYSGMIENQYFDTLFQKSFTSKSKLPEITMDSRTFLYGYINDQFSEAISNYSVKIYGADHSFKTDQNGFYYIPAYPIVDLNLEVSNERNVFITENYSLLDLINNVSVRYDFKLLGNNQLDGCIVDNQIVNQIENDSLMVYVEPINETKEIKLSFELDKPMFLDWHIYDLEKNLILKKKVWYEKGFNNETLKALKNGEPLNSGVYEMYCFNGDTMKEYKKIILLENEQN